ncbi:hypothetical protein [Nonomuraea soli]|uniref:Uncharacterized protein n=1 Tax=Nonomuraea soli TaxID=1032476 RepID=A0A7W0CJL3_9ACTN|nr:hypothetical protein [Nonomuraea soli]MBA2892363.1 hypothetical protein [Nonomuraea soli]
MSLTLTDQDKSTLRTAAYGAVSLLAAATDSPHRVATQGSIALASATGPIGHVLAAKSGDINLYGKTVAELADQVLPALTASVALLGPDADDFRTTIQVAIEAATQGQDSPVLAEMSRKITAALS